MSETESYYLLQDCLVALYYQLYFLKQQCNWIRQETYGDGFGWAFCRYGDGVNGTGCGSWMCPHAKAATENEGTKYNQVLASHTTECGQNGSSGGGGTGSTGTGGVAATGIAASGSSTSNCPSPLQAFLTDCLPGFTCTKVKAYMDAHCKKPGEIAKKEDYDKWYPEFLEHRKHVDRKPGQYCPIPMGFTGSFRSKGAAAPASGGQQPASAAAGTSGVGMSGLALNAIASHYANDDLRDSCLYQLTRCISGLTRRVPRSTGTLYGFFYGMISVYKESGPKGDSAGAGYFLYGMNQEIRRCPGYCDPRSLMDVVTKWKGKTHPKEPGSCCSLDSLSSCRGAEEASTKTSCGAYLHPLTGSLYNSVATQYTDTYLSWILYLTKTLQSGLESLRDAFAKIDCGRYCCPKKDQCKDSCQCKCITNGCRPTKHGIASTTGTNTQGCCCENIVKCAGVYGVLYRFGFTFASPYGLTGVGDLTGGTLKRKCKDFYDRLGKVIDGLYYTQLTEQINRFLYTTRLPFTLVIFGFWSIVIVYLLWSITGPLDLLHIQSHWRSPRSYLVPLQRILADGSRKGFCTIGYFQENTGDRLLSQGVSDVYL